MRARYIPAFENEELEIDEVLDSIAWDLCGRRKTGSRPRKAQRKDQPR